VFTTDKQDKIKRKAEFQAELDAMDYVYTAEYLELIDAFKYENESISV
jgi:hypothetical protein